MQTFVSTFVSGFQKVAAEALRTSLPGVKIVHLLDGLVVYRTDASFERILKLRFANNTFLLIKSYEQIANNAMQDVLISAARSEDIEQAARSFPIFAKDARFRIVFSNSGELVSVDQRLRDELERKISRATRLPVDRLDPDHEFWLLTREEGLGLFMLRLTKHRTTEKTLHQGELRREIAHLLCMMSEPQASDIILDPFCGYGSIPFERARSFPYNLVYARDKDERPLQYIKQRIKQLPKKNFAKNVIVQQIDFFGDSKRFDDGFIDKVITDPPWGLYDKLEGSPDSFYSAMLDELIRIVKPGGLIIVLTALKSVFEKCAQDRSDRLTLLETHHVLVSGKKASAYKLKVM